MTAETSSRPLPTLAELTPTQTAILFSFHPAKNRLPRIDTAMSAFVTVPEEPANGTVLAGRDGDVWVRHDARYGAAWDEAEDTPEEYVERAFWTKLGISEPMTWPAAVFFGADPARVLASFEPPMTDDQTAWERHGVHVESKQVDPDCTYCQPPF